MTPWPGRGSVRVTESSAAETPLHAAVDRGTGRTIREHGFVSIIEDILHPHISGGPRDDIVLDGAAHERVGVERVRRERKLEPSVGHRAVVDEASGRAPAPFREPDRRGARCGVAW